MNIQMNKCIILLILLFLIGCAGRQKITYEDSICMNRPVEFRSADSLICERSEQHNIAPEEIDNFLLNVTLMSAMIDTDNINRISTFMDDADEFLGTRCEGITYTRFLEEVFTDAVRMQLSIQLLNRNLNMYHSYMLIYLFDCWLIHKAIDHQKEQFGL